MVRGVIEENVVDCGKQSAGNSNSGFLGTTPLFEDLILGKNFRMKL